MGRRIHAVAPLLLFPADREAAEAEVKRAAAELVQHDRMRIHEADISPSDMSGQACWSLKKYIPGCENVGRVLDPTCGAGSFPRAIRATWPGAEIVGCEARIEEEPHVAHNCDRYYMGDFFWIFQEPSGEGPFDLIVTNPPFTLIPELLPRCLELVKPGGHVAFVCRLTFGDSEEADPLWRRPYLLLHCHEFAGRWRFRVGINPKTGKPYGVDTVGYRLLIWTRPPIPGAAYRDDIQYRRLDPLPKECRRWRKTRGGLWVKPGTEYEHKPEDLEVLPEVPWKRAA